MKIMLASGDNYLREMIEKVKEQNEVVSVLFQNDFEPVKILSNFLMEQPTILILDDDNFSPNSLSILDSICKLNKKTKIIFTTSNSSIDLGKQVSQLGIYYYAIKPINENEINELFDSIFNNYKKHNIH